MKKTITILAIGVLTACGAYKCVNHYMSRNTLLNLNIEALTTTETVIPSECYDEYSLYSNNAILKKVRTCDDCIYRYVYNPKRKSVCPKQ